MFIRYVENDDERAFVLTRAEMDYWCHILPFTMASVYHKRAISNCSGLLIFEKNPVCLKQIQTSGQRHILFKGQTVEELTKATDTLCMPFNAKKVYGN